MTLFRMGEGLDEPFLLINEIHGRVPLSAALRAG
jgi:hypothetical protein